MPAHIVRGRRLCSLRNTCTELQWLHSMEKEIAIHLDELREGFLKLSGQGRTRRRGSKSLGGHIIDKGPRERGAMY